MEGLRSFSIEELLEQEEKAIFIVDLQALPPTPIYFNPYLRSIELLEQNIIDLWNQADPSYILGEVVIPSPTLQWCAESAGEVDGVANSLTFRGVEWVTYTIGKRYRVITGDFIIPAQDVVTFATSKSESLKTSTISSLQESNAELPALPPPYIPGFSVRLPVKTLSTDILSTLLTSAAPRFQKRSLMPHLTLNSSNYSRSTTGNLLNLDLSNTGVLPCNMHVNI